MILPSLALFAAQAAAAEIPVEQDRLQVCLGEARRDPTTAISNASQWLGEAAGAERALPQQCLGQAYVSLLRWDAAENAFRAARDASSDPLERARLGAMAGSAALPEARHVDALGLLDAAKKDALAAGDAELAGSIAADRSRAFVGLGQLGDAAEALTEARTNAPQHLDAWLLSATLARRQGDLAQAKNFIATAATLAPQDPDVALEAGVVAILSGDEEGARRNWLAVQSLAPNTPQAATATQYLSQLSKDAG